jgi:DNA-binding NarL/FixJ family response regulator
MIRLLVVDDAPFIREIVRHIVEPQDRGFDIRIIGEASDGHEAVSLAFLHQPDVILMDLVLPKLNGIEATQKILAKLPLVKIIAFSTVDHEMMALKAIEAGCCSFLMKPFKAESLIEIITRSFNSNN